jgi:SH3-like domain-containing protein
MTNLRIEIFRLALAGFSTLVVSMPASALDYLSVATAATLYDAPSVKAKPVYVIARDTPVEQVVATGAWVKIRDSAGDLLWIEKQWLSTKRTVIVKSERAKIRQEPDDAAALVFDAEHDVVLELLETTPAVPAGWTKLKHRGGQIGYAKTKEVWGL